MHKHPSLKQWSHKLASLSFYRSLMLQLLKAEDSHAGLDWTGCFPRYVHRPIQKTQWGEDMGMDHPARVRRLSTSAHLLPPGFHYSALDETSQLITRFAVSRVQPHTHPNNRRGRFKNMLISTFYISSVLLSILLRSQILRKKKL